jgi:hypothetical protein
VYTVRQMVKPQRSKGMSANGGSGKETFGHWSEDIDLGLTVVNLAIANYVMAVAKREAV